MSRRAAWAFAGALLLQLPARAELFEDTRWQMGTALRIVIFHSEGRQLLEQAFARVEHWNRLLSNYDATSALSRLNAAGGEWIEVEPELCGYLQRARSDAERTRGLFDLSVGGFAQGGLAAVGSDGIELACDATPPRARLTRPGMALDSGGDGKGVALDDVVELLRAAGVQSALLDFGGSSWFALGRPPEAEAWLVELVDPRGVAHGAVPLVDAALSVSATHKRGEERPHIRDPRSGEMVEVMRWAAVVAASATEAEVISTALIVGGADSAEWLLSEGAGAIVLDGGRVLRRGQLAASPR